MPLVRNNRNVILTDYEWDERLSYFITSANENTIHPMTLMSELTHLWRQLACEHISNPGIRFKHLSRACESISISPTLIAELVKEQEEKGLA